MRPNLCIYAKHAKWVLDHTLKPLWIFSTRVSERESKIKKCTNWLFLPKMPNMNCYRNYIRGKMNSRNGIRRINAVWSLGQMSINFINHYRNIQMLKLSRDNSKAEFHWYKSYDIIEIAREMTYHLIYLL